MTTETPTSEADELAAFSVALDGMRVLQASASLDLLAGRSKGSLIDHPVAELWAPSERDAIAARLDEVVIYGKDEVGALALVRPDGSHVLVALQANYAHRGGERLDIVVVPIDGVPSDDRMTEGPAADDPPERVVETEPPEVQASEEPIADVESSKAPTGFDVVPPDTNTASAERLPETGEPSDSNDEGLPLDLLDAAGVAALAATHAGLVSGATSAAERLLGRSADALVGASVLSPFILGEEMSSVLEDARMDQRRQQLRAGARGGSVHAALEWVPVGAGGAGVLLIQEMRPEDPVTGRLKRKKWLANAAAHDARNQLNAMLSGFATLREHLEDQADLLETLEELEVSRARVRTIIDNTFGSSLGRAQTAELVDVSILLRDVLASHSSEARAIGVEVRDSLEPDMYVRLVADRLRRAIENLIENALRAMKNGGTLKVSSSRDDRDRPGVLIEVADDGIGMDVSEQSQIFEEGYSTRSGSKGLGLAIVRDFIVESGGEIDCVSAPGDGACFSIWLPREAV